MSPSTIPTLTAASSRVKGTRSQRARAPRSFSSASTERDETRRLRTQCACRRPPESRRSQSRWCARPGAPDRDRPQRTPNQPLDFMRSSAGTSGCHLARRPRQCGPRQHAVLARNPALARFRAGTAAPFFDRSGADDARATHLDEHGSFRVHREIARDARRAHRISETTILSCHVIYCSFRIQSSRLRQRVAEVEVPDERVYLPALDQNLHRADVGQVGRDGVDDRIDGQRFVERAARWPLTIAPPRSTKASFALGEEHRAHGRPAGIDRSERSPGGCTCASTIRRACSAVWRHRQRHAHVGRARCRRPRRSRALPESSCASAARRRLSCTARGHGALRRRQEARQIRRHDPRADDQHADAGARRTQSVRRDTGAGGSDTGSAPEARWRVGSCRRRSVGARQSSSIRASSRS